MNSSADSRAEALTIQDILDWSAGRAGAEVEIAIEKDVQSEKSQILSLLIELNAFKDKVQSTYRVVFDEWVEQNRYSFQDNFTSREMDMIRDVKGRSVSPMESDRNSESPSSLTNEATYQADRNVKQI